MNRLLREFLTKSVCEYMCSFLLDEDRGGELLGHNVNVYLYKKMANCLLALLKVPAAPYIYQQWV